jgi:hypothetical protein
MSTAVHDVVTLKGRTDMRRYLSQPHNKEMARHNDSIYTALRIYSPVTVLVFLSSVLLGKAKVDVTFTKHLSGGNACASHIY